MLTNYCTRATSINSCLLHYEFLCNLCLRKYLLSREKIAFIRNVHGIYHRFSAVSQCTIHPEQLIAISWCALSIQVYFNKVLCSQERYQIRYQGLLHDTWHLNIIISKILVVRFWSFFYFKALNRKTILAYYITLKDALVWHQGSRYLVETRIRFRR